MKMVVKGISRKIFRRIALESGPTVHLGGCHMTVRKKMIQQFTSEGSPIYLLNLDSKFSRTKSFFKKNCILLAFGLGMCEGVGEDSRDGFGHVDIQVGSCICLSAIVVMTCALRWGVTHVGNYHYWALLTLSRDHYFRSRDHYFRYRECTGGRRSLEASFRRKPDCGFGHFHFV